MKIIYCADAIAIDERSGKIVVIERLGSLKGLALPGGKQEKGEFLSGTAMREMTEETGYRLKITSVFKTCAEEGYVSTVFIGFISGVPKDEPGKTKVLLMTDEEILKRKDEFIIDHGDIIAEYIAEHLAFL
jgi:8-oxo-dGTP pyrophosphatase MutT (NUDIX family)